MGNNELPTKGNTNNISNILVVDDDRISRMVVKSMAGKYNSVYEAEMISDVTSMLKNIQFCIIFIDIHMPVIDGYALLASIRNGSFGLLNRRTVIVAYTGDFSKGDFARYVDAGFNDCLGKPFSKNEFDSLLKRHSLLSSCE